MDFALLIVAFGFGFAAIRLRLPALVGYLGAGFVLHAVGFETTDAIETISELGVLLLLFGIGLKLKLRTLARPTVWGTTSFHVVVTTILVAGVILAVGALGFPMARDLDIGQAALLGLVGSDREHAFRLRSGAERAPGDRPSPLARPRLRLATVRQQALRDLCSQLTSLT